jgi:putative sigma-54 modulation protein
VAKLEHQLHKLKSKLKRRNHAAARVVANVPADAEPVAAATTTADGGARIVKSKRFAMMPMTPEEAAQRMDLLGHGFFFFTNLDTRRSAVVYRRDDGDVGLIDEDG